MPQNDSLGGTGSVPPLFQQVASLGLRYLDARYVAPRETAVAQQPQETTLRSGVPAGDSSIPAVGSYQSLQAPLTALAVNPLVQVTVLFGIVLLVVLARGR